LYVLIAMCLPSYVTVNDRFEVEFEFDFAVFA